MGSINKYMIGVLAGLGLLAQSCVEPFEYNSETFESAVVVEGTITNEEKIQKVMISTTYRLEEDGPVPLGNAEVRVTDDSGSVFLFKEDAPGIYLSEDPFKAEQGRTYELEFTTPDGGNYASDPVKFIGTTIIEDIFAQKANNIEGVTGVEIKVDGKGTPGSSGYYRYEYVETYKIISPYFKSEDIILDSNGDVAIVPKTKEEYTCFKTDLSQNIVISNTNSLNEDNVQGELLRFIPRENPIFAHRYSILVKQYGISREAYAYYQTLKDLSESESLFSQIQPGYLPGNIYSLDNPDENVLGFFGVASVTERRAYFNYTDFYDLNEGSRPTFSPFCPRETTTTFQDLVMRINSRSYRLFEDLGLTPPNNNPGRYVFVPSECVDCTLIGSNVVPEFWENN